MTKQRRFAPAIEGIVVLLVTLPAALLLNVSTLWLLVPWALIMLTNRPFAEYGLEWGHPGSLFFHLGLGAAVFVPYAVGHSLFAHWMFDAELHWRIPSGFPRQVAEQFLLVALPEEMFFRGYLQEQLDQTFGRRWRILGARLGVGWLLADALFAVCHIFRGGPARLIVFFPGLLYGWLRARTGSIAMPVAYHAVSNLLMTVMLESLRGYSG